MFKKLMKYDLTSVWRLWWIILITMPCATVIGSFAIRFAIGSSVSSNTVDIVVTILAGLLGAACFLIIPVAGVLTAILVFMRFYKNLFSDEGYLTFTLPVSRRSILLSKTLNAFIWFSLYSVLVFVCICAAALIIPPVNPGEGLFDPIVYVETYKVLSVPFEYLIGDVLSAIGWVFIFTVEIILSCVVAQFVTINIIHFCITVGSVVAKKAKILTAIGVYYGISVISSFVQQSFSLIFSLGMEDGFSVYLSGSASSQATIIALIFFIVILIAAAVAAIFYCLTQWLIDRKLNLA